MSCQALEEASDKDHGPVLDCVLFFDGDRWQACVDTAARGDVSHKECMTDYKVSLKDGMAYVLIINIM